MVMSLEVRDLRVDFRGGSVVSRRVEMVMSMVVSSSGDALSAGS